MTTSQQYALVTGGTTGIGYELARLLAADGYNLILVARHHEELGRVSNDISNQYGVHIFQVSKDLFNVNACVEIYDLVKAKGLSVEILINNAGQGQYGEFTDTNLQREPDIIHLHISSVVALTKLFLKDMVKNGRGKILNLSSIASKTPGPLNSVYHATKAFVQSFTEAIREEVKEAGVTITALLAGATDTDFFRKAEMENSKVVVEGVLADAATVAKDGYEAMMNGDDMIVSGIKNKIQVAMSAVTPDSTLAKKMHKQQEPAENN